MAAEKITEVQLESIRLLETKGRTVAAEPVSTYIQVCLKPCLHENHDRDIYSTLALFFREWNTDPGKTE